MTLPALTSYGVSPSNTPTENTIALQATLEAAASMDNVDIIIPPGDFHFEDGVHVETANRITLRGEAFDGCNLHFHGTTGGIRIDYLDATKPPAVDDLNFITHSYGGTALHLKGPVLPTATEGGLQSVNIDARGASPGNEYWDCGLHLENAWHPYVFRLDVQGKNPGDQDPQAANPQTPTFLASSGLLCTDVQAPQIRDSIILHVDTAIKAAGSIHGEGLNISGGELVGVGAGVDWSLGTLKPCIGISDVHINAYRNGIRLGNVGQMGIGRNVHIYKTQLSRSHFSAVELNNVIESDISFKAFTPGCPLDTGGSANGLVAVNSDHNEFDVKLGQWHTAGCGIVYIGASSNNSHRVKRLSESARVTPVGFIAHTGANNVYY